LKSAFAFFVDDIENATARLKVEVESLTYESTGDISELETLIDEILEDSEKAPKAGYLIVSVEALEALRVETCDVSDELGGAFADFAWEMRKALREFKETLVRACREPRAAQSPQRRDL
jgi:RecJ-like exonuclease